ncbi:hypothetical protein ABZ721_30620 [Streptomyces sp. NPDC006733]|uniref:hypothetical protein n=1 Tax=Streptomyces sp. NPDC006733 TaxID=3155460 RepID=UPI0034102FA7
MPLTGMESTLIVSLMGSIELHDWVGRRYADGADDDAFILIVRQSVMQGMAAFHRSKESSRIRWRHHDAGDAWTGSSEAPELLWLQVDTADTGEGRVPLQPIGTLLERVLGRVGTPSIVQGDFLLPLGEFTGEPIEFAYDRDWFAFSDPAWSEVIGIELYASSTDSARADAVLGAAQTWLGDAAVLERGDRPDPGPVEFRGSQYVPLDFLAHADCTVHEWSIELLAWLTEVLGWAMRDAGCGDHGFVRLRRAPA